MVPLLLTVALQVGAGMPAACDDCTLRLEVSADKATYEVGEPIIVSVQLTNVGSRTVMIDHTSDVTGRHDGYRFDVFDETGRRVPDPGAAAVSLLESIGGYVTINSGSHDQRQFVLNYHVAPLNPRRYLVRARFAAALVRRGFAIESNAISITVVATPPERMRQRLADLVAGDPATAAPLLGFTGDPAAIPAVIDLLYSTDDRIAARAMDALLYFDSAVIQPPLLDALRRRGPRDRMIWFLTVKLAASPAVIHPVLLAALRLPDPDARAAAVEGLRLSNRDSDPDLFVPLATLLRDADSRVRQRAASAVGQYRDPRALDALRPALADPDRDVSEQATIAIGWVATGAAEDSKTRTEAIGLLRAIAAADLPGSSAQAKYWLSRVEVK
jgi:HEAT repeats